jgi:hypothetical protein
MSVAAQGDALFIVDKTGDAVAGLDVERVRRIGRRLSRGNLIRLR